VLAAAVAARADVIVTANLKDFPPPVCAPLGVEVMHPDDFLLALLDQAPRAVLAALRQQAADLNEPKIALEELLQMLTKATPTFVAQVRAYLCSSAQVSSSAPPRPPRTPPPTTPTSNARSGSSASTSPAHPTQADRSLHRKRITDWALGRHPCTAERVRMTSCRHRRAT